MELVVHKAEMSTSSARYSTAVIGCMLMGLAGAYLPMVFTGTCTDGIVRGCGLWSVVGGR
ncbi:MAG: hypothetical protein U9R25_09110 [Chloroflexota bacterium]|nr:hypothetical protein [Chloroflexota bacterium]